MQVLLEAHAAGYGVDRARGSRLAIGVGTDDQFVVWNQVSGNRIAVQPRNEAGWKKAWKVYSTTEGQAPSGGGGSILKWVILVVNVLFLVWIIAGVAASDPETEVEQAGTAIGVGIIIVFWAMCDIILGVLYLVLRPRSG